MKNKLHIIQRVTVLLLLFCSTALQAQNAHYATGEVFIDRSGFMYISNGNTLHLEGAMVTVRHTNEAQRGMLSFAGTATWQAGSSAFVNGFVRTNSESAFTFPIGQTSYRPARISKSASAAPTDAAYYAPALHNITALDAGIGAVTNESWVIQGTTPAVITLSWSTDLSSFADDLSKLSIAGWNGAKWVKIASATDVTSPIFGSASTLTGTGSVSTVAAIVPNSYVAYTLAVEAPPSLTYTISATPLLAFGTLAKPYISPAAQTVTVTNTGTGAITLIQPTSTHFVVGALSTPTLPATGEVATFTVQPNSGLPIGDYNEIITITGNDGASATVTVTFSVVCPTSDAVDIDGNTYTVTSLAGLCWIGNMKTTKYADGTDIAWAKPYTNAQYPDGAANAAIFGLFYTWYSAVNVPEGSSALPTPDMYGYIQGICPDGWHIPTQAEWEKLYAYDASDLKSVTLWISPNHNTNLTGFNALPAGKYEAALSRCQELYGFTGYWSGNGLAGNAAHYFYLTYYCDLLREDTTHKANGLSVRCVLD